MEEIRANGSPRHKPGLTYRLRRRIQSRRHDVKMGRMPLESRLKHMFHSLNGEELNLENPRTFCEKINWMKLHYRDPLMVICADKYAARDHVKELVGEDVLIPLLGVYRDVREINFAGLPDRFVLKCTHASGCNIICTDKAQLDIPRTRRLLAKWLKEPYGAQKGEWHYGEMERRIVCEQMLAGRQYTLPADYKVLCFDGEPRYILVIVGRFGNQRQRIFDMQWNPTDIKTASDVVLCEEELEKPACFARMIDIARTLAEGFPFARVDLYEVDARVYFGEVTFMPRSGLRKLLPDRYNGVWGDLITLPAPNVKESSTDAGR